MTDRMPPQTRPPESRRSTQLVRAALAAAGLISATAQGQIQKAGTLFVEVDATQMAEGTLATIPNTGSLGGVFEATGGVAATPVIATVGGTKAIRMDGSDFLQLVDAAGGSPILPPEGIVGEEPSRTIEVWALNPEVAGEETLVSWGKRGGPDGSNVSFGYGSDFRWGAMGHWGGDGPDLGWNNNGGNPAPNRWHHLVYSYDPASHTCRVYVDGVLTNGEILAPGVIVTHPDTLILIGSQIEADGITPTAGLRLSGAIGRVRIHDEVLTPTQVKSNYDLEKSAFVDPMPAPPATPERLAKGPTHRYSFAETAGEAADGARFSDSVGTAHGIIQGPGAAFSGSRLLLPGGPSSVAPFGDLPNGLLSNNSTNNGGTGEFAIETWIKITGARTWSRVFDIGSTTSDDGTGEVIGVGLGGTGLDYLEYSAQIGDDVNSRRLEVRNEDPAGGGVVTADVPTRTFNLDAHVLVTWNESTGRITVYENGTAIGGLTTDDAMSDINDVNVWLGRSNWSGDQNTQGEYDEVRIYDAALSAGQAMGNYQAGPDILNQADVTVTIATHPGNVTAPETLPATFRVTARGSTPIAFQWYRNGTAIPGATGATYVLPQATMADNGAAFTVEVSNTVGGVPARVTSTPGTLTVTSESVTLKHRYSFAETSGTQARDSVGDAHAEVLGSATLSGGSLTLDGVEGTYVNLPNGIITALGDNATFEMWVTYAGGGNWARIFDFGTSTGGEDVNDGGANVDTLFLTSRTGQGFPRFEANFPGAGTLTSIAHPGSMPVDEQEHIVISYSATGNSARMYTNGVLVGSAAATRKISDLAGRDVNNWLGRSQYPDAYWSGKYNEFRIYSGAMGPAQVAASNAAGPDSLPAAAPTLAASRTASGMVLTYTGILQSANTPSGPWSDVADAQTPAAVPASGTARFFRARR